MFPSLRSVVIEEGRIRPPLFTTILSGVQVGLSTPLSFFLTVPSLLSENRGTMYPPFFFSLFSFFSSLRRAPFSKVRPCFPPNQTKSAVAFPVFLSFFLCAPASYFPSASTLPPGRSGSTTADSPTSLLPFFSFFFLFFFFSLKNV